MWYCYKWIAQYASVVSFYVSGEAPYKDGRNSKALIYISRPVCHGRFGHPRARGTGIGPELLVVVRLTRGARGVVRLHNISFPLQNSSYPESFSCASTIEAPLSNRPAPLPTSHESCCLLLLAASRTHQPPFDPRAVASGCPILAIVALL